MAAICIIETSCKLLCVPSVPWLAELLTDDDAVSMEGLVFLLNLPLKLNRIKCEYILQVVNNAACWHRCDKSTSHSIHIELDPNRTEVKRLIDVESILIHIDDREVKRVWFHYTSFTDKKHFICCDFTFNFKTSACVISRFGLDSSWVMNLGLTLFICCVLKVRETEVIVSSWGSVNRRACEGEQDNCVIGCCCVLACVTLVEASIWRTDDSQAYKLHVIDPCHISDISLLS